MSKFDPPEGMTVREAWEKYLAEAAARENDRKRHLREVRELREQIASQTIENILPAVDELERGLDRAIGEKGRGGLGRIREGLSFTRRSVKKTLSDIGVESFGSVGEDFDPTRMNAISRVSGPNLVPGKVAAETRRGYMRHGKLLREADVAVVVQPEEEV